MAPKETRSAAGKLANTGNTITGYIATWDNLSRVISSGGKVFRERIRRGAFANSLANPPTGDIVLLWNHEEHRPPLGRLSAGTLRLQEDHHGLRFEVDAPSWASDIVEAVSRGDVCDCSFGMLTGTKSEWAYEDGHAVRTLTDVRIDEVSLVVTGAYLHTHAEVRNHSACEVPEEPDLSLLRLRLAKARNELSTPKYRSN